MAEEQETKTQLIRLSRTTLAMLEREITRMAAAWVANHQSRLAPSENNNPHARTISHNAFIAYLLGQRERERWRRRRNNRVRRRKRKDG